MKNILFYISILCCVQSCYSPEDWPGEDLPHYEMDEEFKAYFRPANEGSTYIYLDTINGYLDTTTITLIQGNLGVKGSDFTGEGYDIYHECTKTPDYRGKLRTTSEYSYYRHIYQLGQSASFNNQNGEIAPNFGSVEKVDSILINGMTYYDVIMINIDDQAYNRFWFAKNIGVIFKEVTGSRTQRYFLQSYQLK